MNDMKFLCIYLRATNGTGEKITVNPLVTTKQLYGFASQILKMGERKFDLYFRGQKIIQDGQMTLERLKIEQQSIIHIQSTSQVQDEKIFLRIFCRGSIYSYQTNKNSTIYALKQQMIGILGCNFNDIIISHLGKAITNQSSFSYNKIKNKDIISVLIYPSSFQQRSSIRLKAKMAESLTFAATDQIDSNYQPFAKQVLRKSSMKSSHQSREFKVEESKKLLQAIRPKSEIGHNQELVNQQNSLLKLPWLNNQKMIQTESINFDDPQQQDGPELWVQCKIEITNKESTLFCIVQCYQYCDMTSVLRTLARMQRKNLEEIELTFPDQNLQRMAEAKQTILQIAKFNKTKILHNVVLN